MPKIVGRNERGFVDPLSLFGLLFLVVTLAAVTFVTTNKNISLNIQEKAAKLGKTGNAAFDKCREESGREVCNERLGINVNWKGEIVNEIDTSKIDKGADPKAPTCDANGVQYSPGAVVMYGGIGSNATCGSDGKWDVGVGATTAIKPENVPEYAKEAVEKEKEAEKQLTEQVAVPTTVTVEPEQIGLTQSTNQTSGTTVVQQPAVTEVTTTTQVGQPCTNCHLTPTQQTQNSVQLPSQQTVAQVINLMNKDNPVPPTTHYAVIDNKLVTGTVETNKPAPQVVPDNNYGSCNGDPTCNSALTSIDRGMNAISFGGWSNYTEAYSPDKVKYTWQESGYKSVKECQDDMIAKNNNAQAAASCNTYQITKEQAISSIKLGTTLTAEAAAIIALPGAIGAGGTAITAGATTLQVGGAVLAPALTSFGAISTLQQTSAAAVAQITDPGSPEAWKQTGYAALSWLNIGTADKLIKSFGALDAAKKAGQATESLVTAAQSARNLNNVVSGINLAVDVPNAVSTCSQAGFFTGSCGGALAAVGADIVFGTVDYKQGQLGFGNPLTKVNEGALIGRIETPAEIDQINQLIANPFGATPSISNVDGEVKFTPSRQLDMFDQLAKGANANTSTVVNNGTELIFPDKPARQDPNTNFNLTKSDPNEVAAIAAFNSTDINTQGGTVAQLTPSNLNSQIPNTPITDVTAPKPVEPNANIADDITKPLTGTANTDTVDSPATTNQSPTIASLLDDPNASVLDKANGVIDTLPDTGGAISIVKKINQIGDLIFGKKPISLDNLDTPLPPTVRGNAPVMIKPVETQAVEIPYSKELDPLIEVKNAWNKYGDRLTTAYKNQDAQGLIDIAKENGYQVKIVPFGEKVDIVEIGGKTTKMPMTKADIVRIGKSGGKKTLFIATTDVSNPTFKIDDLAHDIGAVITDIKFIPIEKIYISPSSFADFMTKATNKDWQYSDIAHKVFGTTLNVKNNKEMVPITYIVDALTFGEVPSNFLESVPVKPITGFAKIQEWFSTPIKPVSLENLEPNVVNVTGNVPPATEIKIPTKIDIAKIWQENVLSKDGSILPKLNKHPSEKLAHGITGLDIGDPELMPRLIDDHYIIKAKYNLPPREMRFDNPREYINQLNQIAKDNGVDVRNASEWEEFFKTNRAGAVFDEVGNQVFVNFGEEASNPVGYAGNLEHELVHGLQNKYSPGMPVEVMEYEAYVTANMRLNNKSVESENLQHVVFGNIKQSVDHWYTEKGLTNPWIQKTTAETAAGWIQRQVDNVTNIWNSPTSAKISTWVKTEMAKTNPDAFSNVKASLTNTFDNFKNYFSSTPKAPEVEIPKDTIQTIDPTRGDTNFLDKARNDIGNNLGSEKTKEIEDLATQAVTEYRTSLLFDRVKNGEVLNINETKTKNTADIIDYMISKKLLVFEQGNDAKQIGEIMNYLAKRNTDIELIKPYFDKSFTGTDALWEEYPGHIISDPSEFDPEFAKVIFVNKDQMKQIRGAEGKVAAFYNNDYDLFIINKDSVMNDNQIIQYVSDHELNHQLNQFQQNQLKKAVTATFGDNSTVDWYRLINEGHNELLTYYTDMARASKTNTPRLYTNKPEFAEFITTKYSPNFQIWDNDIRNTLLAKGYRSGDATRLMLAQTPEGYKPLVDALDGWDNLLKYFEHSNTEAFPIIQKVTITKPVGVTTNIVTSPPPLTGFAKFQNDFTNWAKAEMAKTNPNAFKNIGQDITTTFDNLKNGFELRSPISADGKLQLPFGKIVAPNPPITPGEVFDPNIEIKNILKSPNRTEALADFKTKLAYQQKGIAKIQTELEKTILSNPAVTFDELTSQVNSLSKTYGLSNTQMGKLEDALTIYQERTTRISELLSDYPDKNDLFEAMFGKKPVGRIEISQGQISIHIKTYNTEDYEYMWNYDLTDPAIPTNTNAANTSGGFFMPSGTLLPDTEGIIIVENNTKWYAKFFGPDIVGIHEDQHALNNLLKQADIYPAPLSGYSDSYYNLQQALVLGDNQLINTSLQNYLDRVKTSANYDMTDEMLAMLKDGTSNNTITKIITQPKNNGGIYDFYAWRKEDVTKIFNTEDLATNKSIQEIIDQNLGTNASKTVINNGLKAFDNLLSKGYTRDEALALLEKTALSDWPKVSERSATPNFITRTTSYISGKIVTPRNLASFQTPSNYLMAGGVLYNLYQISDFARLINNYGWDNTGILIQDWWQDHNPFSSTLPTSETPTGDDKVAESSLINVVNPPPAIPPVIPDSPAKTNEQQKLELERQAKIKSGLYAQIDADLATQTILGGAGKPFKNIGCGQVAVANILCEYGNYCPTPLQIAEQIPLQEYAESGLTSTQSNIKILNENGFTTDPYTKSLQYHLTDYMEPTDVLWISGIVGGIDHHTYIDGYTLDKNGVAIYNLNDSYFGDGYKCKTSGDSSFSCDNPDGSHINIGTENANIYIIDTNI